MRRACHVEIVECVDKQNGQGEVPILKNLYFRYYIFILIILYTNSIDVVMKVRFKVHFMLHIDVSLIQG